jgi:hypothetical protein
MLIFSLYGKMYVEHIKRNRSEMSDNKQLKRYRRKKDSTV